MILKAYVICLIREVSNAMNFGQLSGLQFILLFLLEVSLMDEV